MKFGVVVFPGSNCDYDCQHVLSEVLGQETEMLWHENRDLKECDCIILPGGFSYGDYLRTGAIARFSPVMESIRNFIEGGGLVIGICNGFQILLKTNLLAAGDQHGATLTNNDSGRFEARWVRLAIEPGKCVFLQGIREMELPVAHGEGKFATGGASVFEEMGAAGRLVARYAGGSGAGTPRLAWTR